MSDSKPKYILYHYDPSFAAAVAFIAVFSLSTLLHIWQSVRRRTWYFVPFVVGGLCKNFNLGKGDALRTNHPNSRINRIHRKSDKQQTDARLEHCSIYHANSSHLARPDTIRGFYLHGPCPDNQADGWRSSFSDQGEMADIGVRPGRCAFFPCTISRYRLFLSFVVLGFILMVI
jgi:hypothetical protein